MLDVADVPGYLLDRKLISPSAVVDGGLRVADTSRLNRVFVVTAEGERCFVLKVGGPWVSREAAVLQRLGLVAESSPLGASLPAFVALDGAEEVLILESTPNARDLSDHHARGRFSRVLARQTGRALALLHAIPPAALDELPRAPQPVSSTQVHQLDLPTLRRSSAAAVELIRIVQGLDELCAELDRLLAWWSDESVIHGDIRWDNCLAVLGGGNRWTQLQLIDWELSGSGDPSFDIGGFLGEYLRTWLRSIPIVDPTDPGRLLAHAQIPLRRMRPAVRAFWDAYTVHSRITRAALSGRLDKALRFAAARLLAAALEEAQASTELPANVHSVLLLSKNILARPRETSDLLGLDASWMPA